jgi:hypothetical protein
MPFLFNPDSGGSADETSVEHVSPAKTFFRSGAASVTLCPDQGRADCCRRFYFGERVAMRKDNRRVVIVRRGSPGLLAGLLACIFAVLGIFTLGFIFVPIAALCSLIGLINGAAHLCASGFFVSLLGAFLMVVGFLHSPALWLILGLGAAGAMGH